MNSLPLILLVFANDHDNYLNQISKEMEHLWGYLTSALHDKGFEMARFPYTDTQQLLEYLNDNQQRLVLLHFAGHSNNDVLKLDEGELHIRGLAKKLGSCPRLQLVVLNGCQNAAQVQALRDAKVPAAIGTNSPIGDQTAREFTQAFYTALIKQNLSVTDAFTQAKQDMETREGQNFRSLDLNISADIQQIWAWFLDPPQVSWKLFDAADPCNRLPPLANVKLPTDDNPFRSLRYYRERHAKLFFGRCQELLEVISLLDNRNEDILLIHSATGIGKTSFLLGGLVPRLKARQQVVEYWRYNELDRKRDVREQLFGSADPTAISIRLHQPSSEGLPAIWIIDQVEDAFLTAGSQDNASLFPVSLTKLLKTLHAIFNPPAGIKPPHVKVVMVLRKEWFAELVGACQKYAINQINYPLKPLDKTAIIKIVCSLAEVPELQQTYRLRIEPSGIELANQIADDLLIDKQSSIAPNLQIILYRLWERVKNDDERVWTRTLYETETHGSLLLEDYVDQQLTEIAKKKSWGQEAKDSGLLLDVLFAHTTQQGTTQNLAIVDYEKRYSHIPYRQDLLDSLKKHYLLMDVYTNKGVAPVTETRLIHDTLAQIIENKYDASMLPGQKARRILNGRKTEWKTAGNSYSGHVLEHYDLQQVEEGQNGTSNWREDSCESAIIQKSIKRRRLEKMLKYAVALVLAITFTSSIFFAKQTREKAISATISSLLANAQAISRNQGKENGYADRALLLALHAAQLDKKGNYTSDIYKTMSQVLYGDPGIGDVPFNSKAYTVEMKDEIWVFHQDGRVVIWNINTGKSIAPLAIPASKQHYPSLHSYQPNIGRMVTFDEKHRTLGLWDMSEHKLQIIAVRDDRFQGEGLDLSPEGTITTMNKKDNMLYFWNDSGGFVHGVYRSQGDKRNFSNKNCPDMDYANGLVSLKNGKTLDTGQKQIHGCYSSKEHFFTKDMQTGTIKFWSLDGQELNKKNIFTLPEFSRIEFSPLRSLVVFNDKEKTLQYFDYHGSPLSEKYSTAGQNISIVKFSSNGLMVTADIQTGTIRLWGCHEGPLTPALQTGQKITDIKFQKNKYIITADMKGQNLRFWSNQGKPLEEPKPLENLGVIDVSPSGLLAIVEVRKNKLYFWDSLGKPLPQAITTGHRVGYMKFVSADKLLTWDQIESTIKIWDVSNHALIVGPIKYKGHDRIVVNKQKSLLLSQNDKNETTLWDANIFKPIIDRFSLPSKILAHSPDGEYLAFEESDKLHIRRFDEFTPEGLRKQACTIANRNLTQDEWQQYIGKFLPRDWLLFKPSYQRACEEFPEAR